MHRSGLAHDGPLDYVEVVKDRFKAAARVGELWDTAEREILVLVRPPYIAPPDTSDASVPPGITQRAIYESSILEDPAMVALLHRYAELGEQVRIVDRLPLKLTVIDGRSVAFNMDDPSAGTQSATTVVIHHPELAATLTLAFEALWAGARELPSEIRGGARFEA